MRGTQLEQIETRKNRVKFLLIYARYLLVCIEINYHKLLYLVFIFNLVYFLFVAG
jgi:hypothetical protein